MSSMNTECIFCGKEKKNNWKTDLLIDYNIDIYRITVCRECRTHTLQEMYMKALEKAAEEAEGIEGAFD